MKTDIFIPLLALLRRLPENTRTLVQTIFYALMAGISAICFMTALNYAYANTFVVFATHSKLFFLIASFILVVSSSLIVGILLFRFNPDAAGSGIPQLKAAYWKDLGYVPWRPIILKFFAGILSIGGGASLGREGPTVYIGGGIASNMAGVMGTPARQRRSAVVIGASAGLAAAFNAPLAAITFILEEFVNDINNRFIGRVVLSSLLGAFVVFAFIGRQPAFRLPSIEDVTWSHYFFVPLVAVFASLAGVIFQRFTLFFRGRLKRQKVIAGWLLPCCGGIITWIIGVSVFLGVGKIGVFGLGYHDLSTALDNKFIWWVAGILVIAKLIATILSYSFGACGGIFSPLLFIGGMCGYFIGGLLGHWVQLTPSDRIVLSAVGMSTCLGAVVRAPLTSLLIVFEMTHQFSLIPGLMIGTFIGVIVSHLAGRNNFYDALLLQDGHELIKIRPPLDIKTWQNLPISSIANPHPIMVGDLSGDHLNQILEKHPYNCFPVRIADNEIGIITRKQMESIIKDRTVPDIPKAVFCYPDQTVKDVGNKFIESPSGVIVLIDEETGNITGIVTLHDLLRAQASILE
ncbi:MAG TPA: chloride channel protein [Desulfomonilia bacterium]|nr:chloride channel protein [Desulfomonilia bacterium]